MSNLISIPKMKTDFFSQDLIEINSGDRIHVKGASGSGKTQFLLSLFCLRKFKSEQILTKDNKSLRELIGFLPQSPDLADDSLESILSNHFNEIKEPVFEKLHSLLNIESNKNYSELSGGEQQVFHILLLYYLNKPVMLLDESFSAMDVETRSKVVEFLIGNQNGKAYLFTHHFDDQEFLQPNKSLDF